MAFHFDSKSLRQAGVQAFEVLIYVKRSPSGVIRCRGEEKGTGWFFEMVADSNQKAEGIE